jgi:hypothetical protein
LSVELEKLTEADKKVLKLTCEKELSRRDPFWLIESGNLFIKTKEGELKLFVLKKAQLKLHNLIKKLWSENKIIRIFILKARQMGFTTYIQALVYAITSQNNNINAVDIADDLDGSNYIFEMSKLFHEKTPAHLKTPVKKSNEKKLEFDGTYSQILVDTADNKDAGRKYTFRIAHLSEYAFYKDANNLMLGLSQSVPSMPRTIIIKETTANGFNFAKEEWDKIESGESDYIAFFVPWYLDDDYLMALTGEFTIGDPDLGEISRDEQALYVRMISDEVEKPLERLNWRRWCIRNNCGNGSDKQRVLNFKQEYPSLPIEAFKASGDCYFDQDRLVKELELKKQPLFNADIVYADYKYDLRKSAEGLFRFYEAPQKGAQYVVGGDASSGRGEDYSALVARRKDTNKIVATYKGKIDPDELAYKAMLLGGLLNNATVAIENDKFGFAANQKLRTLYKNIYIQRSIDKLTKKVSEKFGWDTNAVTRPFMLAQMQQEIRQGALLLEDERLIKECLVFIVNEDGKAEAQTGCNDDFVIACAISGAIRRLEPMKKTAEERQKNAAKYNRPQPANAGFSY